MHQSVAFTLFHLLENYLKFWRIKVNVIGYIKDVADLKEQLLPAGEVLRKVRLITLVLFVQLLHLFGLLFFDGCLTDLEKLLWYDISLLMHCPGSINYLLVACTLNELYYFSVLYERAADSFRRRKFWWPILLSNDVLFNREQAFFVSKVWERKKGSGKSLPVELAVRRYTGYWMLALKYFVAFIVFLIIIFQLESFVYIYLFRADFFPLFRRPIKVFLNVLSYAATAFLFYVNMGCLIYTLFVASILFLSLSLIIFIQLQQVDRLIEVDEDVVGFQATTFMRYRRYHAEVLRLTLYANDIYGRLLFAFFAIFVPLNTYLIISMLQGQYTPVGTFILTNCVVFQFSGMIGFHLLAIQYSYRLHSSNRILLHWTAQPPYRKGFGMNLGTRLMLANYALNMHRDPSERFGITYGCLGLMTWATFGNCVFFYLQFMLYWYKLFEQGNKVD